MRAYSRYSDQELLAMLKGRDTNALEEIYDRHWDTLYVHAVKMTQGDSEAQDIVQEVFINLWTAAEQNNIRTRLEIYLFSAVRNRVLNSIRNNKTRAGYIDGFSMYVQEHAHGPLEYISEKELLQAIEEIIYSMPEKMKMVFELSRKEHLSHKEIALKLGVSEKTVKRQISNALKILREKLNKPESLIISIIFYHFR